MANLINSAPAVELTAGVSNAIPSQAKLPQELKGDVPGVSSTPSRGALPSEVKKVEFGNILNQAQGVSQDQTAAAQAALKGGKTQKPEVKGEAKTNAKMASLKQENIKNSIALQQSEKQPLSGAMTKPELNAGLTANQQAALVAATQGQMMQAQPAASAVAKTDGAKLEGAKKAIQTMNQQIPSNATEMKGVSDHDIQNALDMISKNRMNLNATEGAQIKHDAQATQSLLQGLTSQQPTVAMIMQPVVMPMMVPVPVDVLDVEAEPFPAASGLNKMISPSENKPLFDGIKSSSQDFVQGRMNLNDSIMKQSGEFRQKKSGQDEISDQVGVMLPTHLQGSRTESALNAPKDANAFIQTPTAKLNIMQPLTLSNEIQGLARQGGGSLKVRIAPEHLGEMTVSVTQIRGGKMDVKLESASGEAREILAQAAPEIKRHLAEANFKVDNVEVTGGSGVLAMVKDNVGGIGSLFQSSSSSYRQSGSDFMDQHQESNQQNGGGWSKYFSNQDEAGKQQNQNSRGNRYRGQYEQNWV